jgi:hypothetical protein
MSTKLHWPCEVCADAAATYFGPDPYEFEVATDKADVRRVKLCDACYADRLDLVPDDD